MEANNDFLQKYPKQEYGHYALLLLCNDSFRFELTQEELSFLADLNMLQESDPELFEDIMLGYLSASLSDMLTEKEVQEKVKNYLAEKTNRDIETGSIEEVKKQYDNAYEAAKNLNTLRDELSNMLDEDIDKYKRKTRIIDDEFER